MYSIGCIKLSYSVLSLCRLLDFLTAVASRRDVQRSRTSVGLSWDALPMTMPQSRPLFECGQFRITSFEVPLRDSLRLDPSVGDVA